FGARIGSDVHIATDHLAAFDLISIGDRSTVDEGASLLGYTIENGELAVGPLCVGHRCFVGARSVLCGHTEMEDGARLDDLSVLPAGARVAAGETWAGSPPRRVRRTNPGVSSPPLHSRLYRGAIHVLYAAIALVFPLIELLAF